MSEASKNQGTYSKTSPTNYYTIQNWMTHECGLKYPQRDIYAILYGFTQDRTQWVEPTQNYIAELVGVSRKTVNLAIKELTDQGWLRKVTTIVPGRGTRSSYQTVTPEERKAAEGGVTERNTGCPSKLQGVLPSVTGGVTLGNTDNKKIINPISNTINTHTHSVAVQKSQHATEQRAYISADADMSVRDEDSFGFDDFISIYPKPCPARDRKRAEAAFNALKGEKGEGYIRSQVEAYVDWERSQGREERYWKNAGSWLLDGYAEKTYMSFSEKITKREEAVLANPEQVAETRARIANKYEWPESSPCGACGSTGYRDGDTNIYVCPVCKNAWQVRPRRKAVSE